MLAVGPVLVGKRIYYIKHLDMLVSAQGRTVDGLKPAAGR